MRHVQVMESISEPVVNVINTIMDHGVNTKMNAPQIKTVALKVNVLISMELHCPGVNATATWVGLDQTVVKVRLLCSLNRPILF